MNARDDGTPRRVLAMVEIRTRGEMCATPCPCLHAGADECSIFGALHFRVGAGWRRHSACLALDADQDRTPAEAYAHGLGAQDG